MFLDKTFDREMTYQILYILYKLANIIVKTRQKKSRLLQLIHKEIIYKFANKSY